MKFLTYASVLFFSYLCHAGWTSAGDGKLYKDAHNPWFLKNVTTVRYCVQVSTTTVSASAATVGTAVQEAIQYWKNEMARVSSGAAAGAFRLGTQTFTEVNCSQTNVDLRFLVGHDVLHDTFTEDQIKILDDTTQYIGVAVRTEYSADLAGKGFIFIASDKGEKSYHGGTDPTLIAQAWSRPALLKYAIMHELGHVFGLPHTGSGLMSETFLEQILSKSLADAFERTPVESFFSPDNELDFCGENALSSASMIWFQAPTGDKCLHLTRQALGWDVYSRKDKTVSPPGTKIGRVAAVSPELDDFAARPAIVLQLMGNTTLFTPEQTKFRPFMFGPMFMEYGMKGNYVPTSGPAKPVYVRMTPDTLRVQAVGANGKIENALSYASLIGLLLLQDPTPVHP